MKVCLLAPAPTAGGEVSHSVRSLAALLANRHEVTLVHSGWEEKPSSGGALGFREVRAEPSEELRGVGFSCDDHRHSAAAMEAIRAAYGDDGPDYLEVCDFRAHGLVPLQARLSGDPLLRRTIVAVRASPSFELQALHDGTLGIPGMERVPEMEREQLRLADRLLWPGGDVLGLYERHYRDTELPLPVRIPPAVEAPDARLAAPTPATRGGPLRLLYVGALRCAGGALDLADACRWLPDGDWQLTMVGADTETAAMGQSVRLTIEAMGGDDPRIRFEQPPSGWDMQRLWGEHDLLVVPSRLDAWNGAAIAAREAGLPVLATPVGGLTEIVEDGVSGWLTGGVGAEQIGRSLAWLMAEREELERVGRAAAAAPATGLGDPERILRGYEELLGPRSRRRSPARSRPEAEPLVTGIVPYFDAAEYVAEAVGSLLGQTHRNLEVLVVNDGSFAAADSVLAELAEEPRVSVITQPNSGENAARNLGAALAGGEYLAMLDADNLLEPEFVERALAAYRRDPQLAYVTCWLRTIEPDGGDTAPGAGYAPLGNGVLRDNEENWDGDTIALLPARLFTEEAIRYDPQGSMHSDWQLYRRLRSEGRYGMVIPERLARYRILPGSLLRGHSQPMQERGWGESRDRILLGAGGDGVRVSEAGARTQEVTERQRVEELERVNAALAAELRSLTLGRADAPGATAMPTSRRLAKIIDERDSTAAELESSRRKLAATAGHRDEIERVNAELAAEVVRLRSGLRGLLRRTRARLLRSRG